MERLQLCVGLVFDPFNRQELLEVYIWLFYIFVSVKAIDLLTKSLKLHRLP
jgi:hypothetical protein